MFELKSDIAAMTNRRMFESENAHVRASEKAVPNRSLMSFRCTAVGPPPSEMTIHLMSFKRSNLVSKNGTNSAHGSAYECLECTNMIPFVPNVSTNKSLVETSICYLNLGVVFWLENHLEFSASFSRFLPPLSSPLLTGFFHEHSPP